MAFCSKCGAPLEPDARFCNICGTDVKAAPDSSAQPEQAGEAPQEEQPAAYEGSDAAAQPQAGYSYQQNQQPQAGYYYQQNGQQPPQQGYYQQPGPNGKEPNGWAPVTALICGILSVTICCASFIPAVLGLVFGILGLKTSKRTMAIWGIVLGSIGILLSILYIIFILPNMDSIMQRFYDSYSTY